MDAIAKPTGMCLRRFLEQVLGPEYGRKDQWKIDN